MHAALLAGVAQLRPAPPQSWLTQLTDDLIAKAASCSPAALTTYVSAVASLEQSLPDKQLDGLSLVSPGLLYICILAFCKPRGALTLHSTHASSTHDAPARL